MAFRFSEEEGDETLGVLDLAADLSDDDWLSLAEELSTEEDG